MSRKDGERFPGKMGRVVQKGHEEDQKGLERVSSKDGIKCLEGVGKGVQER